MYTPGWKLNWARVYIYRVAYRIMKDEKTATDKVSGITQNIDLGYACFQGKYNRRCKVRWGGGNLERATFFSSILQDRDS